MAMTDKKGKRAKDDSDNITIISHTERGTSRAYTVSHTPRSGPRLKFTRPPRGEGVQQLYFQQSPKNFS
jgi:hypothetical protein